MTPSVKRRKDFRRPFTDRALRSEPETPYRFARWRARVPVLRVANYQRFKYDASYRNTSAHRAKFMPGRYFGHGYVANF